MEAAAEIYQDHLRLNLWIVFVAGLIIVVYLTRSRWKEYFAAQSIPRWTENGGINWEYLSKAGKATLSAIWPIWAWMLAFGIPATIADLVLGPK